MSGVEAGRAARTSSPPPPATTRDLAAVVGRDVAHDRQSEPGAAGVAAAPLVDAVEALEDAVWSGAGMPMPWSATISSTTAALHAGADLHPTAVLGVLHGVLDQVAERRHQLAAVARAPGPRCAAVEHGDLDAARPRRAGGRARRRRRRRRTIDDRLGERRLAELDPRQLHQVVDRAGDAMRLGDHPVGQPVDHLRVVLVGQRLGEHGERADRRLQLVEMLATKSVRTASTRRRSLTSSMVATAEPSVSGSAAMTTASSRRPVQLERLARVRPRARAVAAARRRRRRRAARCGCPSARPACVLR